MTMGHKSMTMTGYPGVRGTLEYCAPEQLPKISEPVPHYRNRVDIWGLGVVTCHMLTGRHPFPQLKDINFDDHGHDYMKVTDHVSKVVRDTRNMKIETASDPQREFISACLKFKSCDRPSAKELLSSSCNWMVVNASLPSWEDFLGSRDKQSEIFRQSLSENFRAWMQYDKWTRYVWRALVKHGPRTHSEPLCRRLFTLFEVSTMPYKSCKMF